ncbi:MAG: hypothetical protein HQM13_15390 [SAR324 cluster bacterium]|nr:hypothetical protein [SAR324 cluster bacterium]
MPSTLSTAVFRGTFIVLLFLAACAVPSDSNDSEIDSSDVELVGSVQVSFPDLYPNSNIVLSIPEGVTVPLDSAKKIYEKVQSNTACQSTAPIDLTLAHACTLYHIYYLYPENLPSSLINFTKVTDYVDQLRKTDIYTTYFDPQVYSAFNATFEGDFATIGFSYVLNGNVVSPDTPFRITGITTLSRAWFDGLKVGDDIIAINGEALAGLDKQAIIEKLPTEEEETVSLTISRNSEELTIQTASEEHIAFLLGSNRNIAYLRAKQYTVATGKQIQADFEELQLQAPAPIEKLILDLRRNGGGSVFGALELVDYLVDQDTPSQTNPILITNGYTDEINYLGEYSKSNIGNFTKSNFVVLIDGASASSSEITVAALKDYGVATIIGEKSFGKGVSQNVLDLVDGSGLIITSHNLLPPSQVTYHLVGIQPDYNVLTAPTSLENDFQLDAAIEFLNTGKVASKLLSPSISSRKPAQRLDPLIQQMKEKVLQN